MSPDGTVLVEGVDLATLGTGGRARMRRTSIGYVFQDFDLIPAGHPRPRKSQA